MRLVCKASIQQMVSIVEYVIWMSWVEPKSRTWGTEKWDLGYRKVGLGVPKTRGAPAGHAHWGGTGNWDLRYGKLGLEVRETGT